MPLVDLACDSGNRAIRDSLSYAAKQSSVSLVHEKSQEPGEIADGYLLMAISTLFAHYKDVVRTL